MTEQEEIDYYLNKYIFKVRNPSRNILTTEEIVERIEKSEFNKDPKEEEMGYIQQRYDDLYSYWNSDNWRQPFLDTNRNGSNRIVREMLISFNRIENRKDIDILLDS